VHRLKGELLLAQDTSNAAEAEQSFRNAIEVARKQSAKSWELRVTMSLARLLAKQGHRDEARAMLADIYSWFTEGFDTVDLKDARGCSTSCVCKSPALFRLTNCQRTGITSDSRTASGESCTMTKERSALWSKRLVTVRE
jgi:hypothetical protein